MKVVLSGFGAFFGVDDNPSAYIAENAPVPDGVEIERHVLAVTPAACDAFLEAELPQRPDLLLCFGVATTRENIHLETTAYNQLKPAYKGEFDARIIEPHGAKKTSTALSGLPELADKLSTHGFAAVVSDDPGRYICNYLYYTALQQAYPQTKVLFVHVPLPTKVQPLEKLTTLPQLIIEDVFNEAL